jgi:galactose mutarotase-like enzyme
MHGLVLDRAPDHLRQPARNRVEAHFRLGDFEGRWPSKTFASIAWTLDRGRLKLDVRVRNVGDRPLPMGVGWHPYFALPSGDRRTARLQLPAAGRLVVNDYDEVLPTGDVLAVAGTPYDFAGPEGAALGTLYLDDCYVGLASGPFRAAVVDRAAGFSLCLQSRVPPVRAVQVYAPPEQAFVVLEPQTNWADPFGSAWTGREPPIALLAPGETLVYQVVAGLMPHQN